MTAQVLLAQKIFKNSPDQHALGMPEDHARGHILMKGEEVQILAQFSVIAFFRFFQLAQVTIQLLWIGKGSGIDTAEHAVFFIAAPVSSGYREQLERLDQTGSRQVRAAAKVDKLTNGIQAHRSIRNIIDQLYLVVFTLILKESYSFFLGNDLAREELVLLDDLAHLRFDGRKIFRREGFFYVKIVIEAGFNGRADGHLGVGVKAQHRLSQDVGRRVAQNFKALRGINEHRRYFGSLGCCVEGGERGGKVEQPTSAATRALPRLPEREPRRASPSERAPAISLTSPSMRTFTRLLLTAGIL